eukprot:13543520-Heterocapsa_arctica.AAC.1
MCIRDRREREREKERTRVQGTPGLPERRSVGQTRRALIRVFNPLPQPRARRPARGLQPPGRPE